MSDDKARKRLRRKVLDRWENEGGKLGDALPDDSSSRDEKIEVDELAHELEQPAHSNRK